MLVSYIILQLLQPCNSEISTSYITHLSPSYYLPYNVLRITRCGLVDGIPGFTQAAWVRFQASTLFDSFKLFPAITLQRWNSPDKVCFENCHLISEKVNCIIKETMFSLFSFHISYRHMCWLTRHFKKLNNRLFVSLKNKNILNKYDIGLNL